MRLSETGVTDLVFSDKLTVTLGRLPEFLLMLFMPPPMGGAPRSTSMVSGEPAHRVIFLSAIAADSGAGNLEP